MAAMILTIVILPGVLVEVSICFMDGRIINCNEVIANEASEEIFGDLEL